MADEVGQVVDEELDAERQARRQIALAQIRQYPDPALRMQAREVEAFDGDLERLVERMSQLMVEANGVGLAAPQVGVLRRLFVFRRGRDDEEGSEETIAVVNPQVVSSSEERESEEEGCLSLQGIQVPVERHLAITLLADDGTTSSRYGVNAIPHTVVIDRDGTVRRVARGGGVDLEAELAEIQTKN